MHNRLEQSSISYYCRRQISDIDASNVSCMVKTKLVTYHSHLHLRPIILDSSVISIVIY